MMNCSGICSARHTNVSETTARWFRLQRVGALCICWWVALSFGPVYRGGWLRWDAATLEEGHHVQSASMAGCGEVLSMLWGGGPLLAAASSLTHMNEDMKDSPSDTCSDLPPPYHPPTSCLPESRENTVGILVVNLGSPNQPTYYCLWKYLSEFLSDSRVIEFPKIAWKLVLNLAVLPFRSASSSAKYKKIWSTKGSPLVATTYEQAEILGEILNARCKRAGDTSARVVVEVGMRYGTPTVASGLQKLKQQGIGKILIFPLYPQPAAASTSSVYDVAFKEIMSWRVMPHLRMVAGYSSHPAYIMAIAHSIEAFWKQNGRGGKLLFSYHGLPVAHITRGDTYATHCERTTLLVAQQLKLQDDEYEHVYQSRFGVSDWLQPYTWERLEALAKKNVQTVDIVCPGFSADCLETLMDVEHEFKDSFDMMTGGKGRLRYVACLNATPGGMNTVVEIAEENILGWMESKPLNSSPRNNMGSLSQGYSL